MCVRDTKNPAKTEHLSRLNDEELRGSVSLFEADLFAAGSYDDAFTGATAVIHAGATVGFNRETPQEVYDGCFKENTHVIESVKKSGSGGFVLRRPSRPSDIPVMKVTFSPKRLVWTI